MRELRPNNTSSSNSRKSDKRIHPTERIIKLKISKEEEQSEPYINEGGVPTTIDNFEEIDEDESSSESTKRCMWDCHPFKGEIVGIPLLKGNQHIGMYCSYECAVASLFNQNMTQHDKWHIYHRINKEADAFGIAPVRAAPPIEMLKDFGGSISIDDFRNTYTPSRTSIYHVFNYPMIRVHRDIEDISSNHERRNKNLTYRETRNNINETDTQIREKSMV